MSKKENIKYTDEPIQIGEEVPNFLPKPEDLVFTESKKKVTISLEENSVAFFKREAQRLKVPYQRMIRNLLNEYVNHHKKQASR